MSTTSDAPKTQGQQHESLEGVLDRIPDNWNGEGQYSIRLIRSDEGKEAIVTVIEPPKTVTQPVKTLIVDPHFLETGWRTTDTGRLNEYLTQILKEDLKDSSTSLQANDDDPDVSTLAVENGKRDLVSLAHYRCSKGSNGASKHVEQCMGRSVGLMNAIVEALENASAQRLQGMLRSLEDGWSQTFDEETKARATLLLRKAERDKAHCTLNSCYLRHAILQLSCDDMLGFVKPTSKHELKRATSALKVCDERVQESMQAVEPFLSSDESRRTSWNQVLQGVRDNVTASASPAVSTPKTVTDTVSDPPPEPTVHLVYSPRSRRFVVKSDFLTKDYAISDHSATGNPHPLEWVNDESLDNSYTLVSFGDFTKMLRRSILLGDSIALDALSRTLLHLVSEATRVWEKRHAALHKIEQDPQAIKTPSMYWKALDEVGTIPTERGAIHRLLDTNRSLLNSQTIQHVCGFHFNPPPELKSSFDEKVIRYDRQIQTCLKELGYTPGDPAILDSVPISLESTEGKTTPLPRSASSAWAGKSTHTQRAQEMMSGSNVSCDEEEEEEKENEKKKNKNRNARSRQNKERKKTKPESETEQETSDAVPRDAVDAASFQNPSLATLDGLTGTQITPVNSELSHHGKQPTSANGAAGESANSSPSPSDPNILENPPQNTEGYAPDDQSPLAGSTTNTHSSFEEKYPWIFDTNAEPIGDWADHVNNEIPIVQGLAGTSHETVSELPLPTRGPPRGIPPHHAGRNPHHWAHSGLKNSQPVTVRNLEGWWR